MLVTWVNEEFRKEEYNGSFTDQEMLTFFLLPRYSYKSYHNEDDHKENQQDGWCHDVEDWVYGTRRGRTEC